ncbi:MAG: THUMP domain-containing protein [Prolixibacteraceae bacterium]|nr:THUMP domain-containing protein [Prolixibacteraceae bacterium]
MKKQQYTATTLAGLEEVLAQELIEIGADEVQIGRRSVYFSGDVKMLYKANYCLRTALRILVPIDSYKIYSVDDLYQRAKNFKWEELFDCDQTFAIQSTVFSDLFDNSMYASLKLKDAIVDRFRYKFDKRPNVDSKNPDVLINLHISAEFCTISLDSSGESLHKRGYRVGQNEAPMSEVLAAGLLRLSDWDQKSELIDPMCGSGTIAIEAAMLANGIYPGSIRKNFGFKNWRSFKPELFKWMEDEVQPVAQTPVKISASDILRRNIDIASKNANEAGVASLIDFKVSDFRLLEPASEKPFLLFNPPYGERLTPDDTNFYGMIGERLKHHYTNATVWMISTPQCLKSIGLRPSRKIPILNGSLECSFRKYELYSGSKKISSVSVNEK